MKTRRTTSSTPENLISAITETDDQGIPTPPATTQSATYNNLNELTNLSGQVLTWDANGNLLSDSQRTYTWDAENRLISIGYPGQSGKATAFNYDGLGRWTTATSTPAGGGSATTTSYLWCGLTSCQARDPGGAVSRSYYAEGELATFRAYDPVSGRWLSRDPIGESGGINLYSYVQDNPLIYVDPLGLAWQWVIGSGGTVIVPFFGGA